MKEFTIQKNDAGQRLDRCWPRHCPCCLPLWLRNTSA